MLFLFSGCSRSPQAHPEQIAAMLKAVNALPENNPVQIRAIDSAFSLIPEPGIADRLELYGFKCAFYQRLRLFDSAFRYADSMLDLTAGRINRPKFAEWYATALASKGDIYLALKKYDESFLCYSKARVISVKVTTDTCGASSHYTKRLADLQYKQKKYEAAAEYYKLALRELACSVVTNPFLTFVYTQMNLGNVGLCYAKMNQWDSASVYFNAAQQYLAGKEPELPTHKGYLRLAKAVVWGNLARCYQQKNDNAQAESLYVRSIGVYEGHNDNFCQDLQLQLAGLYISQHRFREAGQLLDVVADSLRIAPDEDNWLKYYQTTADYQLKQGQSPSAIAALTKYIAFRDSVDERNRRFASIDIGADMARRYQEALNENLRKDNRLKELYLIVAVIITLLVMIIFSLLLYNSKKSASLNRQIALKNERERISKELHDDLGSGLTALQIMVRRIAKGAKEGEREETLQSIGAVSEGLVDQMSEIIWVLNNTNDTVNGVLANLRVYMADYIEKTGLNIALDFNYSCEENYSVNSVLRRNLLLVIKEVFHNVVKHAGASRFSLSATCENKTLHIVMQDDGRGLADDRPSKGNGIRNIQSRISSLQGRVSFENDQGLQVTIDVPV